MYIAEIPEVEFNVFIDETLYYCAKYGIDRVKPNNDDKLVMYSFFLKVHEGWKEVQNNCIQMMCKIDDTRKRNKKIFSDCGNDKAVRNKFKEISERLKFQESICRSFMDAIIWTIFSFKEYILRRYCTNAQWPIFNKLTIFNHLKYIDTINRDPSKLAILTDLSKFFHIGDYIQIDLSADKKVSIVEIKEGSRNSEIIEAIQYYESTKCGIGMHSKTITWDSGMWEQYNRILKQKDKASNVQKIIRTNRGIDPITKKEIRLSKDETITEVYLRDVYKLCDKISKKEWAICEIDECLYLGMYKNEKNIPLAFNIWMELIKNDSPIIDYYQSFLFQMAKPMFSSLLPYDITNYLAKRKIVLKISIDIRKMIKVCQKNGIIIELLNASEVQKRGFDFSDMWLFNKQAIMISNIRKTKSLVAGGGLAVKILFSFFRPISILKNSIESMQEI